MKEHFAKVTFGDEVVKATRHNTIVYTHYGTSEVYDHVFIKRDEEYGGYVWAQYPPENPVYTQLAALAVQNGAETHLNIQTVSEGDVKAFGKQALKDLDLLPEWMPEV